MCSVQTRMESLPADLAEFSAEVHAPGPVAAAKVRFLARLDEAADARIYKLEAHQVAHERGSARAEVDALYKRDLPLLAASDAYRFITEAWAYLGRETARHSSFSTRPDMGLDRSRAGVIGEPD